MQIFILEFNYTHSLSHIEKFKNQQETINYIFTDNSHIALFGRLISSIATKVSQNHIMYTFFRLYFLLNSLCYHRRPTTDI